MEPNQAIVERTSSVPTVRTLVVGKVDLQAYYTSLVAEARQRVTDRRALLEEAERGVVAARAAGEPEQERGYRLRIGRRRHALERAERFEQAVSEGYLPIPRLQSRPLRMIEKLLPAAVLESLAEAKRTGLFDEFRLADGEDETTAWGSNRRRQRDPILIGVCDGEMFPLAWWR